MPFRKKNEHSRLTLRCLEARIALQYISFAKCSYSYKLYLFVVCQVISSSELREYALTMAFQATA
jgi:hypothetical protein